MAFYSIHPQSTNNIKYKRKLKKLKRTIENFVFENAALCDQVAQIQENILCVKEERRYLLKKLVEQDSDLLKEESKNGSLQPFVDDSGMVVNAVKRSYKKRVNSEGKTKKGLAQQQQQQQQLQQQPQPSTSQTAMPMPTKQIVQTITVNANGVPMYPINMGHLSVYNLGEILSDRPGYHTENWIYPARYTSTRVYGHIQDPERKCVYTCKIIDNGDFPRFEIVPDSDMNFVIAGPTPDLCHAALIQSINNNPQIRNIDVRPQGEWFFGLAHPTVMTLLQTSPNALKCKNFKTFNVDAFSMDKESDPSINYEALQRHIALSAYHTVLEVRDEPPDELFEQTSKASVSGKTFNLPLKT